MNLVAQTTERNVKNFGGTSPVSRMVDQCLANELTLDLRNCVTDKLSNDLDLARRKCIRM